MQKVVIITGGSSGIGKACYDLFSKNGYIVYSLSRRLVEGINGISTDITNKQATQDAIKKIYDAEGRIDVLINNAGMGISGAIEDTTEESAKNIFDVNFFGSLYCIQAVIPYMREKNSGHIINVSSAGAPLSLPFQAFYSASKSALCSLSEGLRIEVAPFGIKVSSILPGDVKTKFTSNRQKNISNPIYGERIKNSISRMEIDEQNGMSADFVAKKIYNLLKKKNPPLQTVCGFKYVIFVCLAKIFPKKTINNLIGKLYG